MSAGSSHLEVDDDEGGEQITVLVRVGDTELRARVRRALACSAVLLEIDDAAEADVVVTDDTETADRRTVLLADDWTSSAVTVLAMSPTAIQLRIAIEACHNGLVCRSPDLVDSEQAHGEDDDAIGMGATSVLSAREIEVLQIMSTGASNKAIARALGISVHTAKFHVTSIMSKLGASSRTDAVARAMRTGLVMI